MSQVADWGQGRYYYANDSDSVPRIFTSKPFWWRTLVEEHTFVPNVRQDHEVLRGIELELPPLRGYVLAYPKPAEVLLVSDKADPVLAVWRYGLGARQPSPLICAGAGGRHGLNGRTSANLPVSSCVGPSVRRCVKTCG